MAEEKEVKKETIIIPRLQKFIPKKSIVKKKISFHSLPFVIVLLYAGLLVLVSYLPIPLTLKILGLLIGSFILEDVHHFLKKIWKDQQLS